MTNWVRNIIKMKDIDKMPYYNEYGAFDFNKIMPMPRDLNIQSCAIDLKIAVFITGKKTFAPEEMPEEFKKIADEQFIPLEEKMAGTEYKDSEHEWACLKDMLSKIADNQMDELYEMGERCVTNILLYGSPTWYEWCWENWGCKWNASGPFVRQTDIIKFETPYAPPGGILRRISRDHPSVLMECVCLEESGVQWNFIILNGEISEFRESCWLDYC